MSTPSHQPELELKLGRKARYAHCWKLTLTLIARLSAPYLPAIGVSDSDAG
jgi:hypothetical protein